MSYKFPDAGIEMIDYTQSLLYSGQDKQDEPEYNPHPFSNCDENSVEMNDDLIAMFGMPAVLASQMQQSIAKISSHQSGTVSPKKQSHSSYSSHVSTMKSIIE